MMWAMALLHLVIFPGAFGTLMWTCTAAFNRLAMRCDTGCLVLRPVERDHRGQVVVRRDASSSGAATARLSQAWATSSTPMA